jgi:hypothetical protein
MSVKGRLKMNFAKIFRLKSLSERESNKVFFFFFFKLYYISPNILNTEIYVRASIEYNAYLNIGKLPEILDRTCW